MKYIVWTLLVGINVYGMQPIDTAEIDKLARSQDLPSAQEYGEQQNFAQALEQNVSMAKMKLNPQIFAEIQNWSARELQILREKQLKAESQKAAQSEPVTPAEQPNLEKNELPKLQPSISAEPVTPIAQPQIQKNVPPLISISFANAHQIEGDHGQFTVVRALLHFGKGTSSHKQKSQVDEVRVYSNDVRLPGYKGTIIDAKNAESFAILQGSKNKFFALIKDADVVVPIEKASILALVKNGELVEIPAGLEKFNRLNFQVAQVKPVEQTIVDHLLKDKTIAAKIKDQYGNAAVKQFWENTGARAIKKLIKKFDPTIQKMITEKFNKQSINRAIDSKYDDLCYETRVISKH